MSFGDAGKHQNHGLSLKRCGCALLSMALCFGLLAIVTHRSQLKECDQFKRMELESLNMPDLDRVHILHIGTTSRLNRIARLHLNRVLSGFRDFTLRFSPDDTLLAISGVGYFREWVSETFLWKLTHSKPCILEIGNIPASGSFINSFEAFSLDSQYVLLHGCDGVRGSNCYSLWDTQYNRLVNSFYTFRFVRQGDELLLEYQEQENSPPQMTEQHWQAVDDVPHAIYPSIVGTTIQLIDRNTGNVLRTIQAQGRIHDAEISHDGKLLALAVTQPILSYRDQPNTAYIELWGIINISNGEN